MQKLGINNRRLCTITPYLNVFDNEITIIGQVDYDAINAKLASSQRCSSKHTYALNLCYTVRRFVHIYKQKKIGN